MLNTNNDVATAPERKTVTVEFDARSIHALSYLLDEYFADRDSQAALTMRPSRRERQIDSLRQLYEVTQKRSQTEACVVARFLACLYDSARFKFDLTDFRSLDTELFEHCLNVLRLDFQPTQKVHCYFERGEELWERMINDYDLDVRRR